MIEDINGEGESVLQEAQRLTHGPRNGSYGSPLDDYETTAALMTTMARKRGILKEDRVIDPQLAALFMIAVKLSRELHCHKRDNAVDIAGYAWVSHEVIEEQTRREKKGRYDDYDE